MIPEHICLGVFTVCTGISLLLLMRGYDNDTFSATLVFTIALFQLLEFGVWNNLDCDPKGSNDKATRLSYMLFWLAPALLALSAAFFSKNVIGDDSGRKFLLGIGIAHLIFVFALVPLVIEDKTTWCSQPGNNWIIQWWYLREKPPLFPNLMWFVGVLSALLLVVPILFGVGALAIGISAFFIGKKADGHLLGEWFSVTTVLSNIIALWALIFPPLNHYFFGFPIVISTPVVMPTLNVGSKVNGVV